MNAETIALKAVLEHSHHQEDEIKRLGKVARQSEKEADDLQEQLREIRRTITGQTLKDNDGGCQQVANEDCVAQPVTNEMSARPRCPTCGR
jgi:uncharacterized tellurite resistance protein B-like protein